MKAIVTATACASLLLSGCGDLVEFAEGQRFREEFQISHELSPGGRLELENQNGAVEISGWEKSTVEIVGSKFARSEDALKEIRIDVSSTPHGLRIRTLVPENRGGGYGARYVLRVPTRTTLNRIVTSNGSVRVDAMEGEARLRTSNGSVKIRQVRGPLEVQTSNSSIEVNNQSGGANLRTTNGSIRAEGVGGGGFEAVTSNSSIRARVLDVAGQQPIRAETSNGNIDIAIERWGKQDIRARTSNSGITLRLPAALDAMLRAHTSHGAVRSGFDVHVQSGEMNKSHVEGTIGSGGAILDLSTSNGDIKVEKL